VAVAVRLVLTKQTSRKLEKRSDARDSTNGGWLTDEPSRIAVSCTTVPRWHHGSASSNVVFGVSSLCEVQGKIRSAIVMYWKQRIACVRLRTIHGPARKLQQCEPKNLAKGSRSLDERKRNNLSNEESQEKSILKSYKYHQWWRQNGIRTNQATKTFHALVSTMGWGTERAEAEGSDPFFKP
jgi:hypothetical protein